MDELWIWSCYNLTLYRLTDHNIFIILYGVFAVYFAGVMVRLMLVLAPVMCILSGIAVSSSLNTYMKVQGDQLYMAVFSGTL